MCSFWISSLLMLFRAQIALQGVDRVFDQKFVGNDTENSTCIKGNYLNFNELFDTSTFVRLIDYTNELVKYRGPDSTNFVALGDFVVVHNLLSITSNS